MKGVLAFVLKAQRLGVLLLLLLVVPFSVATQNKRPKDLTPYQKYVVTLPHVDRVQILAVRGISSGESKEIDCSRPDIICTSWPRARVVASKTLTAKSAAKVSGLWRKLRRGNGAGCFAPAYVLRFYQKDKLVLTTDVCFHCCNITLPGEEGDGIASICGNEDAIAAFKKFVTTEVPVPTQ